MSQGWYINSGGRLEGPVSARELRNRAAAGLLRPTDLVSTDGQKWAPASRVKGLKFASAASTADDPPATVLSSPGVPPAAPPKPPAEVRTDQIPGYEVVGVLGSGACGIVYRARQVKLDRVVALKTVLSEQRPSPAALARFEKEAVSLAKLKHPNIVGIYDCGHHDGRAYFAMELLDGEDLCRRITRAGPLDEFTAWHVARQTAAALAHAAELGVLHRDVKPANLYLTPPPTGYPLPPGVPLVKVTDFGLALTRQAGGESTDQRLTAAGVILGTPAYMPPEQFAGSDIDHRADLYALGATVFHCLTGRAPFGGATVWEVMLRKAEPPPRLGPPASRESADLVAALMAENPADRVPTYRDLIDRIDALPCMRGSAGTPEPPQKTLADEPAPAPAVPAVPAPRTRRRAKFAALAVLGGVVLATGVALGVKYLGGDRLPSSPPPSGGPVEFATGDREALFDQKSILGWVPAGGPAWTIEEDDEKLPVLTGKGGVRRPFRASRHFRVVVGLDLHEAAAAEVVVATADGPPETARQWSVRIDRAAGAAFGERDGERGAFRPLGAAVPVPTRKETDDEGRRPYQSVRYERAGGKVRAWYRDRPLGETEDDGKLRMTEVKVLADGGAVRIDTADVDELVEKR